MDLRGTQKRFKGCWLTTAFLGVVALLMLVSPTFAVAANWSLPFQLSSAEGVRDPFMTYLPDGSSTMVWNRDFGTARVADREPGGEFELADEISGVSPSDQVSVAGIASSTNGMTAVVLRSFSGGSRELQVAVREPGGSFEPPEVITASDQYFDDPWIGIGPDGTLVVTWVISSADPEEAGFFAWAREPGGESGTITRLGSANASNAGGPRGGGTTGRGR